MPTVATRVGTHFELEGSTWQDVRRRWVETSIMPLVKYVFGSTEETKLTLRFSQFWDDEAADAVHWILATDRFGKNSKADWEDKTSFNWITRFEADDLDIGRSLPWAKYHDNSGFIVLFSCFANKSDQNADMSEQFPHVYTTFRKSEEWGQTDKWVESEMLHPQKQGIVPSWDVDKGLPEWFVNFLEVYG